MIRRLGLAMLLILSGPAFGHFIFVVPGKDDTLSVVMSETLEPDSAVRLGPVKGLKLNARGLDGKVEPITLTAHDHHLTGPATHRQIVFGSLDYGVTSRGGKPFLLCYHPKAIIGGVPVRQYHLTTAPAEIVPERERNGELRFRVWFGNAKAADAEVTVLVPDGTTKKVKTDAEGLTPPFAQFGRYGVWARVVENKPGEFEGEKYEHIRHYPSLVFDHSQHPPLPEAVSSFGAVTSGDSVYVYGGHRAKVHSYDKQAVSGSWHRLNLKQPQCWEELPAGSPVQGLALVAYENKLIRIGGMTPKNDPGTKTDNHSTSSCAIFDPTTKAWTDFPVLPQPRSSHDAVVIGDTLLVVGGWNMRGSQEETWAEQMLSLDLRHPEKGWSAHPQPFRRRALQAGVQGNRMYVIGGIEDDDAIVAAVDVYDPAAKKWSRGPDLPGGKKVSFNPGICSLDGKLYVSVGDGTVAQLSPDESNWIVLTKLAPRVVHRMTPIPTGGLLIMGGAVRNENLDEVEFVPITGR